MAVVNNVKKEPLRTSFGLNHQKHLDRVLTAPKKPKKRQKATGIFKSLLHLLQIKEKRRQPFATELSSVPLFEGCMAHFDTLLKSWPLPKTTQDKILLSNNGTTKVNLSKSWSYFEHNLFNETSKCKENANKPDRFNSQSDYLNQNYYEDDYWQDYHYCTDENLASGNQQTFLKSVSAARLSVPHSTTHKDFIRNDIRRRSLRCRHASLPNLSTKNEIDLIISEITDFNIDDMTNSDWLIPNMTNPYQVITDITNSDQLIPHMTNPDQQMQDMTNSNQLMPNMTNSDQLMHYYTLCQNTVLDDSNICSEQQHREDHIFLRRPFEDTTKTKLIKRVISSSNSSAETKLLPQSPKSAEMSSNCDKFMSNQQTRLKMVADTVSTKLEPINHVHNHNSPDFSKSENSSRINQPLKNKYEEAILHNCITHPDFMDVQIGTCILCEEDDNFISAVQETELFNCSNKIGPNKCLQQRSSIQIGQNKCLQQRSSNQFGSNKCLQQRSSNLISPNKSLQQRSSNLFSPNKSLQQRSSNLISPNKSFQPRSSNLISPNKSLQQRSSNIISPNKRLQQRSSNLISPNKSLQQRSSSLISPNKSLQQRSSNKTCPNRGLQQRSCNLISPNKSLQQRNSKKTFPNRCLLQTSFNQMTPNKCLQKGIIEPQCSSRTTSTALTSLKHLPPASLSSMKYESPILTPSTANLQKSGHVKHVSNTMRSPEGCNKLDVKVASPTTSQKYLNQLEVVPSHSPVGILSQFVQSTILDKTQSLIRIVSQAGTSETTQELNCNKKACLSFDVAYNHPKGDVAHNHPTENVAFESPYVYKQIDYEPVCAISQCEPHGSKRPCLTQEIDHQPVSAISQCEPHGSKKQCLTQVIEHQPVCAASQCEPHGSKRQCLTQAIDHQPVSAISQCEPHGSKRPCLTQAIDHQSVSAISQCKSHGYKIQYPDQAVISNSHHNLAIPSSLPELSKLATNHNYTSSAYQASMTSLPHKSQKLTSNNKILNPLSTSSPFHPKRIPSSIKCEDSLLLHNFISPVKKKSKRETPSGFEERRQRRNIYPPQSCRFSVWVVNNNQIINSDKVEISHVCLDYILLKKAADVIVKRIPFQKQTKQYFNIMGLVEYLYDFYLAEISKLSGTNIQTVSDYKIVMVECCKVFTPDQLTTEICLSMLLASVLINSASIIEACLTFAFENIHILASCPDFLQIPAELLVLLLCSDHSIILGHNGFPLPYKESEKELRKVVRKYIQERKTDSVEKNLRLERFLTLFIDKNSALKVCDQLNDINRLPLTKRSCHEIKYQSSDKFITAKNTRQEYLFHPYLSSIMSSRLTNHPRQTANLTQSPKSEIWDFCSSAHTLRKIYFSYRLHNMVPYITHIRLQYVCHGRKVTFSIGRPYNSCSLTERQPSDCTGKLSRDYTGGLTSDSTGKLSRDYTGELTSDSTRKLSSSSTGELSSAPIRRPSSDTFGSPSGDSIGLQSCKPKSSPKGKLMNSSHHCNIKTIPNIDISEQTLQSSHPLESRTNSSSTAAGFSSVDAGVEDDSIISQTDEAKAKLTAVKLAKGEHIIGVMVQGRSVLHNIMVLTNKGRQVRAHGVVDFPSGTSWTSIPPPAKARCCLQAISADSITASSRTYIQNIRAIWAVLSDPLNNLNQ